MVPFRYRRRVGWGDCDPARIIYAPRAIDYALEAADGWLEAALGVSWADLALRHGREAQVLAVHCAYERPFVEGQGIDVAVEVVEVGAEAFTLRATGELAPGDAAFRAELVLCLAARGGAALPLPAEYGERLARHVRPGAPASSAGARARSSPPVAPPGPSTFTRQRRVRYWDCGLSGDAHPTRVVEWAVEAVGEWYAEQLGISWLEQCRRGRGTPFLSIRCEYLGRMEPGRLVTMAVSIPRLGTASIGYAVAGRDEGGAPCFVVDMSACQITEESGAPRAAPFPDEVRERILAFRAAGVTPAR